MKLNPIQKMVKDEKTLCIYKTATGDVWIGTGLCMYNVGQIGGDEEKVVRWLFGISDMEYEQYDKNDCRFIAPPDDASGDFFAEDGPSGYKIEDYNGNVGVLLVFCGAVFVLAGGELAPLRGEKNLSYRYDAEGKRIHVYRGMFAVASFSAQPMSPTVPFVQDMDKIVKLMVQKE